MRDGAGGGGLIEFVIRIVNPLPFIGGVLGIDTKEFSLFHAVKKRSVQFVDVRYKSLSLNRPQELPVLEQVSIAKVVIEWQHTSGPSQVKVTLMILFCLSRMRDHSRYSSWTSRLESAAFQRLSSLLPNCMAI